MAMDLTVTSYETWDDLLAYMDGSAAVIGEMMLPILEPFDVRRRVGPARDLGEAFQLTNFLRDVGEDLDRGRVYVPQEDVRALRRRSRAGAAGDAALVRLMRFEIDRSRQLYRSADSGIELLPAGIGPLRAPAAPLYAAILDEIEANDFDVFAGRAVPTLAQGRHGRPRRRAAGGRLDGRRRSCSPRVGCCVGSVLLGRMSRPAAGTAPWSVPPGDDRS